MGSFKLFALAGVLAVATSTVSKAADLLPPPPPPPVPYAAPVEVGGNWYLRGDVGVGQLNIDSYTGIDTTPGFVGPPGGYVQEARSIGDQVFVGAGIGYQWNSWLRFDITGEYRTAAHFSTTESYNYGLGTGYDTVSGHIASAVGLFNGYVDLGKFWGISPFIGAGIGVASHHIFGLSDTGGGVAVGGVGFGRDDSWSDAQLAWAVHAGLGYEVSPNLKLEIAYRYLNMGDATGSVACATGGACPGTSYRYRDIDSHDIKIGMRWVLGAAAPVREPISEPIIRKY